MYLLGRATHFTKLWCCMWVRGQREQCHLLSSLPAFKRLKVLQPSPPQPPQLFTVGDSEALFAQHWNSGLHGLSHSTVVPPCLSTCKCWTAWSTSRGLLCRGCPSPPLPPAWMNVSSLSPWLSDFHTNRFPGSSGCFFVFKLVVALHLIMQGSKAYLPTPPSWLKIHIQTILWTKLDFMEPMIRKPSWENCPGPWFMGFIAIKVSKEAHLLSSPGNLVNIRRGL